MTYGVQTKESSVAGQEYEILVAAENEFGMSGNATERLVTPIGVPDSEPLNIRYVIRQKLVSDPQGLSAHC